MTTLSEASPEEWARVFDLSITEAKQLAVLGLLIKIPDFPGHLTIEEVERLRETGELSRLHPYVPWVPMDAPLRWRQLAEMLRLEPEFAARYPAARALLLNSRASRFGHTEMLLPSFGVRIARYDPRPQYTYWPTQRSGPYDASSTSLHRAMDHFEFAPRSVDVKFSALDKRYLRGILLAVLCREESNEWPNLTDNFQDPDLLEGVREPEESWTRLTDLRLAVNLSPIAVGARLTPSLEALQRPITAEKVIAWKLRALEEPAGDLVREFGDHDTASMAASFCASALCLFVDLGARTLHEASSRRLGEQVDALAEIVKDLVGGLYNAADNLEKLIADRTAGRQPLLENSYYQALRNYRMGSSLEDIARALGTTPYDSSKAKGSKSWKRNVKAKIARGKEVENARYPRAAAVFDSEDHPAVRQKATQAYEGYEGYLKTLKELAALGYDKEDYDPHNLFFQVRMKARINIDHERGQEVADAYVQLGARLKSGRPPLP